MGLPSLRKSVLSPPEPPTHRSIGSFSPSLPATAWICSSTIFGETTVYDALSLPVRTRLVEIPPIFFMDSLRSSGVEFGKTDFLLVTFSRKCVFSLSVLKSLSSPLALQRLC